MEEDEDVVEGAAELVDEHLQLDVVVHHRQHELFQHHQSLARQPYYPVVQLEGLRIASCVEAAELAGT